jgi:hypothetical protein
MLFVQLLKHPQFKRLTICLCSFYAINLFREYPSPDLTSGASHIFVTTCFVPRCDLRSYRAIIHLGCAASSKNSRKGERSLLRSVELPDETHYLLGASHRSLRLEIGSKKPLLLRPTPQQIPLLNQSTCDPIGRPIGPSYTFV